MTGYMKSRLMAVVLILICAFSVQAEEGKSSLSWITTEQFDWLVKHARENGTLVPQDRPYRQYRLRTHTTYGDVPCSRGPLSQFTILVEILVAIPEGDNQNESLIRVVANGPLRYMTKETGEIAVIGLEWSIMARRNAGLSIEPEGYVAPILRIGENWYSSSDMERQAESMLCFFIESEKRRLDEEASLRRLKD
ncbi:MAG: hypothetical protein AAB605_03990 [Patescibacteria group bacterium]